MTEVESTVEQEFDAATNAVALVDRSTIARIEVTGSDRLDLLHRLSTNNLASAKSGQIVGTAFTTDKGRIVDYVHILVRESSLLLFISPTNESKFVRWIEKYTIMEDIKLNVVTNVTSIWSLIGPTAKEVAQSLTGISIEANTFVDVSFEFGKATVAFRNEFQTDFVDFIVAGENQSHVKNHLMSGATNFGLIEMRPSSYEFFRVSRGIPSFGHELSDAYNPYEAGLLHAISFTKGCYIGQEVIARLDTYQKVQRSMYGIVFDNSSEIQVGATVLRDGEEVGVVTSKGGELIRGKSVGIGILKKDAIHTDDHVSIVSSDKDVFGVVRSFPLVL